MSDGAPFPTVSVIYVYGVTAILTLNQFSSYQKLSLLGSRIHGFKGKREWVTEENRLETFDIIINVLKEHEKSLDDFVCRLDALIETLSTIMGRLEYLSKKI